MSDALWTDSQGRTWLTTVTVSTIKRVRELVDVNLLEVFDDQLLARLADDPVLLANTLYAVCKPQADELGVSDEAFGELLAGDTIEQAAAALVRGLISFFPQGRRQVLARLWTATTKARCEMTKLATSKLDSPQMNKAIDAAIQQAGQEIDQRLSAFGEPSGSLPETSASIPVP